MKSRASQVSAAPAAHQEPHGIEGNAKHGLEPIKDRAPQVYRSVVAAGAAGIEAGRQQRCYDRDRRRRTVDPPEEPGMIVAHRESEYIADNIVDDSNRVCPLRWKRVAEQSLALEVRNGNIHRPSRKPCQVVYQPIDGMMTQASQVLIIEVVLISSFTH